MNHWSHFVSARLLPEPRAPGSKEPSDLRAEVTLGGSTSQHSWSVWMFPKTDRAWIPLCDLKGHLERGPLGGRVIPGVPRTLGFEF